MGIINILTAILTIVIAIIGTIIGIQQFRINRTKLRLALYKERKLIYNEIEQFIATILRDDKISLERIQEFSRNTKNARFLFDEEINHYLNEIVKKAFDFYTSTEKPDEVAFHKELFLWFEKENKNLRDKFEKYLQIEKF